MIVINPWVEFSNARKLAAELQKKYCGEYIDVEYEIIQEMYKHPLYQLHNCDWILNIVWDDEGFLAWLQIVTEFGAVPR